nr:MAG TPA: hypothetical protein [Caudoviricetes sp.]
MTSFLFSVSCVHAFHSQLSKNIFKNFLDSMNPVL